MVSPLSLKRTATNPAQLTVESERRRRDGRIDFWRGVCLFGMVLWHLLTHSSYPKWISLPVIQSFNFVAEGFVLLAGASIGMRWTKETTLVIWPFVRRSIQFLFIHYAMVLALWLATQAGWLDLRFPPWHETLWGIATLSIQPYLADIVTLFVFLFASTPLWQWLYRYGRTSLLVASSVTLYTVTLIDPTLVPINTNGAFDFGTWQLYFVLGLALGIHYPRLLRFSEEHFGMLFICLLFLFLLSAAWRIVLKLDDGIAQAYPVVLSDSRKPLTLFRTFYILVQLQLFAVVTIQFWDRIADWILVKWAQHLGRNSMLIFVASVFLDYSLKALLKSQEIELPFNLVLLALELFLLSVLPIAVSFARSVISRRLFAKVAFTTPAEIPPSPEEER